MKKLLFVLCLVTSVAFGADVVPVVAPVVSAPVSIFAWFKANSASLLGLGLALSEVLALIPAFKGNGILDTIIKALVALSGKSNTPQA